MYNKWNEWNETSRLYTETGVTGDELRRRAAAAGIYNVQSFIL